MSDGYYDSTKIYHLSSDFYYDGPKDDFKVSICGWIYPYRLNEGQNIIELKTNVQNSKSLVVIKRKNNDKFMIQFIVKSIF